MTDLEPPEGGVCPKCGETGCPYYTPPEADDAA